MIAKTICRIILFGLLLIGSFETVAASDNYFKVNRQYYNQKISGLNLPAKDQIAIIDTLIHLSRKSGDRKGIIELELKKADLEFKNCLYVSAFNSYQSVLSHLIKNKSEDSFANELTLVYMRLGKVCYLVGKYDDGIFYMYEFLKKNRLNVYDRAEAYIQLGNLYLRLQKDNIVLKHLNEAEQLLSNIPASGNFALSDLRCRLYICYSSVYIQKKMKKEAFLYIEKAKQECNGNKLFMSHIYQNTSILHWQMGDLETVEKYSQKAIALSEEDPYVQSVLLNNLAILYLDQKRYKEALAILKKNLLIVNNIEAQHVVGNLYSQFSRTYEVLGNYKEALYYRKKEQEILDSIFDKESEERIIHLNNKYETEKLKYQKELVEYKLKVSELNSFKKNTLVFFSVVLLLIAIAGVVATVQKIKKKKKENSLLKRELQMMDEDKNRIIQSSKEKYETEIDYKVRELTTNTMYIAKMCDVANQILKESDRLIPFCNSKEAQDVLHSIQRQINSLTVEERGWNDFKLYFEQIHSSFFSKLHDTFPDLTAGESRLCAFIVMNLSTKEIAVLTNRSIRTVETLKFRIRKKMDIPKEVSTLSFLQQFVSTP